jgi:K+-transporting ATPase ATPase C chain
MIRETVQALVACVVTFVLCAIVYPAAVWGLGQLTFPSQAEGSLIYDRERNVIGSELIAQPFANEKYFYPRPSAVDYKADATGGSNLGTKNPDLRKKIAERAEALKATEKSPAPVDLVTASGGGMDPHITPEAAIYQAARVASARKMKEDQVRALIDRHIERSGEIIGAPPRVNVLRLNLDLDQEKPAPMPLTTAEPAPAPAPETPAVSGDLPVLRSQIGVVSDQLKQLHARLNQQVEAVAQDKTTHEKAAADLKDLEAQVARLAEDSRAFPALVERVDGLDARAKSAMQRLQELQSEVGEARDTLKQIQIAGTAPAESAKSAPVLAPGLDAFRQGHYSEAADVFLGLTKTYPDDARVWYYAALAKGLATKQWRGEAEELVNKGVERERAGTPDTASIEAALAGLSKTTGKDWLSYYRQRASKR